MSENEVDVNQPACCGETEDCCPVSAAMKGWKGVVFAIVIVAAIAVAAHGLMARPTASANVAGPAEITGAVCPVTGAGDPAKAGPSSCCPASATADAAKPAASACPVQAAASDETADATAAACPSTAGTETAPDASVD